MSAQEVIEQIKALPPRDQARVAEFVRDLEPGEPIANRIVHFATASQAKAAGDNAVKQYEEVFRKLH